jgi:hypothetical protein
MPIVPLSPRAGNFAVKIPYALAVTLEIAEPIDLKIFNEMQARIRLKVGIAQKIS